MPRRMSFWSIMILRGRWPSRRISSTQRRSGEARTHLLSTCFETRSKCSLHRQFASARRSSEQVKQRSATLLHSFDLSSPLHMLRSLLCVTPQSLKFGRSIPRIRFRHISPRRSIASRALMAYNDGRPAFPEQWQMLDITLDELNLAQ
jgi:hypothetical protein